MNKMEIFNFMSKFSNCTIYPKYYYVGGGVFYLKKALKGKWVVFNKVEDLYQDKLFKCCYAKFHLDGFSFVLVGF